MSRSRWVWTEWKVLEVFWALGRRRSNIWASATVLLSLFVVLLVGQPGLWDTLFSILLLEVGLLRRLLQERWLSILVCPAANLPTVRMALNTQLSVGSALNELFIMHFM